MARIRQIKPQFWSHEDLGTLPELTQLFAIGLLNFADDEGYFNSHPVLLNSQIFPFRNHSATVPGMLSELSDIGYIRLFSGSDGKSYGVIEKFNKHQRISKAYPSKIKDLETVDNHSATVPQPFQLRSKEEGVRSKEEGVGKGGDKSPAPDKPKKKKSRVSFVPDDWQPDQKLIDELTAELPHIDQVAELKNMRDHEYAKPKSDWRRCYRTWMRNADKFGSAKRSNGAHKPRPGDGKERHYPTGRMT